MLLCVSVHELITKVERVAACTELHRKFEFCRTVSDDKQAIAQLGSAP
jgi:hypothetical protein